MSNALRENMCDLKTPGKLRKEIDEETLHNCLPTYVRYACQYWVHHLEESEIRVGDQDAVYVFLHEHFLHWLEGLALIGKISESIALIGILQSLVAVKSHCTILIGCIRLIKVSKHLVFFMMQGDLCCRTDG